MKSGFKAAAVALVLGTVSHAALAQYTRPGRSAEQTQEQAPAKPEDKGKLKVSKEAFKALQELQAAVNANDRANIPAKVAAAQAVAKTPQDRLVIAQLQLNAAASANDKASALQAMETMLSTGLLPQEQVLPMRRNVAQLAYELKQYDKAAAAFDQVLAANPNDAEMIAAYAEVRNAQGRPADAVALLQRAFQAKAASGQKAPESWYRRAVALAYDAKLPATLDLSRQWLAAYPSPTSWRDALRVYRNVASPDEMALLDSLRLARATNALSSENEYHNYAVTALKATVPVEGKAVLQEAIAAKAIDPSKGDFKELISVLESKAAADDRASLEESAKTALAGNNARVALKIGDAFYGHGDYARAAELYRAALTKPNADSNLINLHLGMALARSGDKAGAAAALRSVGGQLAELAKYWLVYVGQPA